MNLRKAIRTVKLTSYAAWERGGSIVKGTFVSGEVYRYDADGYVLCREDIDVNGTVVECPDRKVFMILPVGFWRNNLSGTGTSIGRLCIEVMSVF